MTRIRNVGGSITKTTGGDHSIYSGGDIVENSLGANLTTSGSGSISFKIPKDPPNLNRYFVRGWWSLDEEGNKPIKSAVPGMKFYFHLETKNIENGKTVYMTLYDEDNSEKNEIGNELDKDDKIVIIDNSTKLEMKGRKVFNNKIVYSITLDYMEDFFSKETDRVVELYYRCSYLNQNAKYPENKNDYLKFSEIIADRYKMPGLNENGTDIANDLTFGKGVKNPSDIYSVGILKQFKEQYTKKGKDLNKYLSVFSNRTDVKDVNKAKYSEEECYNAKVVIANAKIGSFGVDIPGVGRVETPEIDIPISISTGFDIRVFNLYSTDRLFWNFETTAKLYFANDLFGLANNLGGNLSRMIAFFKANNGGIYEDKQLTEAIVKDKITLEYCKSVENYISKKIKANIGDLLKIEDRNPYFGVDNARTKMGKNFSKPVYSQGATGGRTGLTIALNDIWAAEVTIKELKNMGNSYTCKYEVILWDHFGLDLPDMEKMHNLIPSVSETFVTWFILQHLRGFKPFITKIKFEKSFKGTF